MNYAFTEMNFGDEGRVITALPLRYLYLGDTWGSGKVSVIGTPSNFGLISLDITGHAYPVDTGSWPWLPIVDLIISNF